MKTVFLILFHLLWTLKGGTLKGVFSSEYSCIPREYGKYSEVCVCNSTYCDIAKPLPPFPSRMFNTYISSQGGARLIYNRKKLNNWINPKSVKITVNSSITYQTIIGFGGALSDAAAINIDSLSQGSQDRLLASYFSKNGLEYNLLRIPIGGTDYSTRPYTLNENRKDTSLSQFNLSYEDINYKIPYLKKIRKLYTKKVQLLATAWTAPPWMKTNDDYTGMGVLKDKYYALWSKYHLRFLEEYEKHGLSIWGITTGYKPSSGLVPFYPYNCMGWTPFSQSEWVSKNLGPDLSASRFNKTKIITLDDLRFFLPWWPKIMLSNKITNSYVSGIGVQWYWDFILPSKLLDLTHEEFPEKFILGTEASFDKWKGSFSPVVLGSWSRAEEYAESIINDLSHWVSGWMDSNIALDLNGGPSWKENFADAALIVNSTADEFYKQPMFYALAHFSKFIPRKSIRIDVRVTRAGIKAVGFRTPRGNVVIVLLNKKLYDVPVTIIGALMGNANILLPKKSIMTLIYRDKKRLPLYKVFL